jgi:hypothetical protein
MKCMRKETSASGSNRILQWEVLGNRVAIRARFSRESAKNAQGNLGGFAKRIPNVWSYSIACGF